MAHQSAAKLPSGSINQIKNIAIVGAGGQIGKHITAALLKKGTFNITALTRSNSTTPPPTGLATAIVNYDDPSTLVTALKGQDALVITMAINAPPDTSEKLVRAAASAGTPYILPNDYGVDGTNEGAGADTGIGPRKIQVRALVEELGVSKWISVTTGFWYEYSLAGPGVYGIDIQKREVVFFDEGTQKIETSTWPQVGRAVASVLSLPIEGSEGEVTLSSYANRVVYVSSFKVSQRDMFEAVKRVTGTEDKDWKVSSVPAWERFKEAKKKLEAGDSMWFMYVLYTRYFIEDAGLYVGKELDNKRLGLPDEDLDEFTKEAVRLSESGYFDKLMAVYFSKEK